MEEILKITLRINALRRSRADPSAFWTPPPFNKFRFRRLLPYPNFCESSHAKFRHKSPSGGGKTPIFRSTTTVAIRQLKIPLHVETRMAGIRFCKSVNSPPLHITSRKPHCLRPVLIPINKANAVRLFLTCGVMGFMEEVQEEEEEGLVESRQGGQRTCKERWQQLPIGLAITCSIRLA